MHTIAPGSHLSRSGVKCIGAALKMKTQAEAFALAA